VTYTIAYLPGDGVGPEVAGAARRVAEIAAQKFNIALAFQDPLFGGAAIDACGDPFPDETRETCLGADAVLLGAIGGPKWDHAPKRPEPGLLALRKELGLFSNLRPVKVFAGQEQKSPLKDDRARGVDIMFVRELTGGIYFGAREEGAEAAWDQCAYSREEVVRVARVAFNAARARSGRVTSVDKANVLATSRLWRKTVTALQHCEYPDVELHHEYVDAMAMKLIQAPAQYDVVLTENLFGDILSDEASVIAASIGLAPSASIGSGKCGLYEPIHGSAPDIAGQDKANPAGAILSAAMMFRFSLDSPEAAAAIETAVESTLAAGHGTADIGGTDGCDAFAERICIALD
jgi:3-isopropylmalate dehydrogenase